MDELELLRQAVGLAKAGRKEEAREVLTRILRSNPNQEYAWLWMTTVVETDDRRIHCFKKVLEINPNNAHARQGLQELQSRPGLIPESSGSTLLFWLWEGACDGGPTASIFDG